MGVILGLSILLLFGGYLAPPANGGRYAACQVLCGGGEMFSYPGFFYKLPSFTRPERPSISGRFFGGDVEVGWEDHTSHEEIDLSGYEYKGARDGKTNFKTIKIRNHTKNSSGGTVSVKLGQAAG